MTAASANRWSVAVNKAGCKHETDELGITFWLREPQLGVSLGVPDCAIRNPSFRIAADRMTQPDDDLYALDVALELRNAYDSYGIVYARQREKLANVIAYLRRWQWQDQLTIATERLEAARKAVERWQAHVDEATEELTELLIEAHEEGNE